MYAEQTRNCKTCNEEKVLSEFYFRNKYGIYSSKCKNCTIAYEKVRRILKKTEISEYKKQYHSVNKELIKQRRLRHKIDIENRTVTRRAYENSRLKSDIQFRLQKNYRKRIYNALKRVNMYKSERTEKMLGCDIETLKTYLSSKFEDGMTWDNYGEWHIDHIFPISKVDLTNEEEVLKVFHYTNLQPLWKIDNIKKGNKCLK